jgi:hypothetical protein
VLRTPQNSSLSEGLEEEGEHAVTGDIGKGGEFEGVVAAGEFEGAGIGPVAAEGVEHLSGELREHGGIIFPIDHEGVAAGAHAAFDVGHGADGGPEFAEFVDGDVVAKALPDMIGGHALADDVGVVGGDVEEAAGADAVIVHEGDVADGGANAGAEDAEFGETLLLEPVETTAGVVHGLAIGLESKADIGATDLVGALVAAGHTAVVVGHAHFENGDAHALDPVAEAVLAVPFGVPVGEEEDSGALFLAGKELGVDGVVFGPRGVDGAGERQNIFRIETVVGGGAGGVPFPARFDGILSVLADEGTGVELIRGAADVLEAPVEGLDAAIVVGGPTAVLVATDFALEPIHESRPFSVYSQRWEKKKLKPQKRALHRIPGEHGVHRKEESVRDGARVTAAFVEGVRRV